MVIILGYILLFIQLISSNIKTIFIVNMAIKLLKYGYGIIT